MRRLTLALLTVGVLATTSACAAGDADDVVTVTSQVAAPPADSPAASPVPEPDDSTGPDSAGSDATGAGSDQGDPSPPESPQAPTSAAADGTDGSDPGGSDAAGGSDPETAAGGSASGDASTGESSDEGDGTDGTAGSGSGFPIQTPTENLPDVSRDVAGPDKGRPCAADAKYWDEDPTGMRDDVIAAWRNVEKFANADGVIVCLNDGKRSTAQQQAQYDEYVAEYGKEVADQLVLAPENSAHVTGDAMDVQPAAAYQWLQATEGALGLCRIYDNEPWHFEYDVSYFTDGCPPRLPKPEN